MRSFVRTWVYYNFPAASCDLQQGLVPATAPPLQLAPEVRVDGLWEGLTGSLHSDLLNLETEELDVHTSIITKKKKKKGISAAAAHSLPPMIKKPSPNSRPRAMGTKTPPACEVLVSA